MKPIKLLSLLLISTMLLINSCSENTTDTPKTPTGNKYFPTQINSWWTYNNYELDSLGNKIEGNDFQYKVVLDTTVEKEGKTAFVFNYQNMDGEPNGIESDFIYSTTTQIYKYFSIVPETDFSLPIEIPTDWYKISDYNDTEWTLYSQTVEGMKIETEKGTATLKGDIVIKVKNEGTENVNYGANLDKSVECYKFNLTFSFDGEMEMGSIPIPIPFKFSVENYNYYGEGIGVVKSQTMPMSIKINILGSEQEVYSANGNEKILLDYKIGD